MWRVLTHSGSSDDNISKFEPYDRRTVADYKRILLAFHADPIERMLSMHIQIAPNTKRSAQERGRGAPPGLIETFFNHCRTSSDGKRLQSLSVTLPASF